jgi:hypothetical protein
MFSRQVLPVGNTPGQARINALYPVYVEVPLTTTPTQLTGLLSTALTAMAVDVNPSNVLGLVLCADHAVNGVRPIVTLGNAASRMWRVAPEGVDFYVPAMQMDALFASVAAPATILIELLVG